MKKAAFGNPEGPLVTPTQFMARATSEYKAKGIRPYCPACKEYLHVYGPSSPNTNVTSHFSHQKRDPEADPLDDCALAERTSRYSGLEPRDWDFQSGKIVREEFRKPDNIARAYSFCHALCGNQNLSSDQFISMVKRADRQNIWSYAGIQEWIIPYVLLTLENFEMTLKDQSKAEFHALLIKPKRTPIDALWEKSEDCKIVMVYSDTGRPMIRKGVKVECLMAKEAFVAKAGDAEWVRTYRILPKLVSAI